MSDIGNFVMLSPSFWQFLSCFFPIRDCDTSIEHLTAINKISILHPNISSLDDEA